MILVRPRDHGAVRDGPVVHLHLLPVFQIVARQHPELPGYGTAVDGAFGLETGYEAPVRSRESAHVGNGPSLIAEHTVAAAVPADIDPVNLARILELIPVFDEAERDSVRRHADPRDLAEYRGFALGPCLSGIVGLKQNRKVGKLRALADAVGFHPVRTAAP